MKIENLKLKINPGFTLVELLVVVAIIGILAAALLIGLNPLEQTRKAQDSGKLSKCKEAIGAAERYYAFHNTEAGGGASPTCAALVTAQELKANSCTGVDSMGGNGTTSYTCTFTAVSTAFQAADKCGQVAPATTCTVPTEF